MPVFPLQSVYVTATPFGLWSGTPVVSLVRTSETDTGFEITEKILKSVHEFLNPGGHFITELGFEGRNFINKNYDGIELSEIIKDYSGIDRAALFKKI